jgi:hypothetical protein
MMQRTELSLSSHVSAESIARELRSELGSPDHAFRTRIETWLAYRVLYSTVAEVYEIDSGYDRSTFGQWTDRSFDIADFESVDDFLEQPTGDTRATYLSGSGFAAETIRDALFDEIGRALSETISHKLASYGYADDASESREKLWEQIEDLPGNDWLRPDTWIEAYATLPLRVIVEKHRAAADFIAARLRKERHAVSARVHALFLSAIGGRSEKFVRGEIELLLLLLTNLSGSIGEGGSDDVAVYVHSSEFATLTSKSLREDMQRAFPTESQDIIASAHRSSKCRYLTGVA